MLFKNLISCNRHNCNKISSNVRSSGSSVIDRAQYYVELKRLWGEIFPPPHKYHNMERLSFQDFVLALAYISKYSHRKPDIDNRIDALARYLGFSSAWRISGELNTLLIRLKNELPSLSSEVMESLIAIISLIDGRNNQENSGEEQRCNLTDEEKLNIFLKFLDLVKDEKYFVHYYLKPVLFGSAAYSAYDGIYGDKAKKKSDYDPLHYFIKQVAHYAGDQGNIPEWLASYCCRKIAEQEEKEYCHDMHARYNGWMNNERIDLSFISFFVFIEFTLGDRQCFVKNMFILAQMVGIKEDIFSKSPELRRLLNSRDRKGEVDRNKVFTELFGTYDVQAIVILVFKHRLHNSEGMEPFATLSKVLYGFETSEPFKEAKNILKIIKKLDYRNVFQPVLQALGFSEKQAQHLKHCRGYSNTKFYLSELVQHLKSNESFRPGVRSMFNDMGVDKNGDIFSISEVEAEQERAKERARQVEAQKAEKEQRSEIRTLAQSLEEAQKIQKQIDEDEITENERREITERIKPHMEEAFKQGKKILSGIEKDYETMRNGGRLWMFYTELDHLFYRIY